MANAELISIFSQIADLLDIKGEDGFRVNSYRRVARAIDDLTQDITELAKEGKLDDIPGVGKASREKIEQFLATGKIDLHTELMASVPAGLPPLLDIPGLGPKKVAILWNQLNIQNLDDLKKCIESGKLSKLKGFGAKSVEQIMHGIEFVQRASGRTPLGMAWPIALELADYVRSHPKARRVDIAGSLRRGCETIGDIDLLCDSDAGAEVIAAFCGLPSVVQVLAKGDSKGSVIVRRRDGFEVAAQLRAVPSASYGAALLYFTGSKEHNVRLREMAGKKDLKLNEWGLFDGEKSVAGADEESVYKKLGLPWLPPEIREDHGEFALTALPKLIERKDLRGDLHMHTSASDGILSAEEMAKSAAALGYEYIAITDHSRSSTIANGLTLDRMWRQIEKLRQLNESLKNITILVGCECDVLADGSLDYPDSILAACDFVVASVHAGLRGEKSKNTARVIKAMSNPFVTVMGHPTGRLINKREPMELDMEAVVAAAAKSQTALELNASWQRLDLHEKHLRMAKAAGVMICIDTDAHAAPQLEQMEYGIKIARRAWLTAEDVLNTRSLMAVKKWIGKKRKAAHDMFGADE